MVTWLIAGSETFSATSLHTKGPAPCRAQICGIRPEIYWTFTLASPQYLLTLLTSHSVVWMMPVLVLRTHHSYILDNSYFQCVCGAFGWLVETASFLRLHCFCHKRSTKDPEHLHEILTSSSHNLCTFDTSPLPSSHPPPRCQPVWKIWENTSGRGRQAFLERETGAGKRERWDTKCVTDPPTGKKRTERRD